MSADHEEFRGLLGAYAVGAVDDAQRARLQEHLDSCQECRADLVRLDRTTRRLALAEADRLTDPAPPSEELAEQLFARLAAERRRVHRLRFGAGVASAAAAVAAALVLVVALRPAPTLDAEGLTVAFTQTPPGVTAVAELHDWGWGTQLILEIEGLDADQRLAVWLERPDGSRVPAGSFLADDGDVRMMLGAGARTADAVALGVSDSEGTTVLLAPLET